MDLSRNLSQQNDIITALFYIPKFFVKYIHYRDLKEVEFRDFPISIPSIPFIPYNDKTFCCLLDKILGKESQGCESFTIKQLGTGGKIGVPYLITTNDSEFVLKLTKVDEARSEYQSQPPTSLKQLDIYGVDQCITKVPLTNIRYIASDEFTNETLIAYLLNYLASQLSLPPLYVKHYQGVICDNYGMNIMENCDLGPLDNIINQVKFKKYIKVDYIANQLINVVQPNIIYDIIKQITVSIHMLTNYVGFVSGDLKAGNIFLKSEAINMDYQGIKLKSDFICKVADYGKSSAMLRRQDGTALRLYYEKPLSTLYLSIDPFTTRIFQFDEEYYYISNDLFVTQTYTRTMNMGIPFYKSFDYYTVLLSMLTRPYFYYTFFSTDYLRNTFWDPIWKDTEEANQVLTRLKSNLGLEVGKSLVTPLTILRGISLKCAAVNIVMSKLLSNQR